MTPTDQVIPAEHAETILQMMHVFDARGVEGIDYDAIRELARWIYRQHPGLREKHRLDG